jgi:subtilisin-like proprotein convertase family protein
MILNLEHINFISISSNLLSVKSRFHNICSFFSKVQKLIALAFALIPAFLILLNSVSAQTYYPMSSGNYYQDFADMTNWTDNYAAGSGADNWKVAANASGSSVNNVAVFVSNTTGGVQRGAQSLIILATGSNTGATDLLLNFSGRTAGTLSLDWSKVVNTAQTSPRSSDLKIQYSIDGGSNFTDITGYTIPRIFNNSSAESGTLSSITLPAALNNQSTVVLRFFVWNNGQTGGSGNRPKWQLDNISVTSTAIALSAQILSVSANATAAWCPGETKTISVTIKNVGTQAWTDGGGRDFNIGVKWNTNGSNWNDYHVRVDAENLAAGATATYNLTLTASNATVGPVYGTLLSAGTNRLTFDVVLEGDCWFGWNSGSCGPGNTAFTTGNITINSGSLPSPFTISGPSSPCVGTSQTYTATSAPGTETWTFPSGWTITGGQGTQTCVVTVGASTGNVICSRSNSCGSLNSSNTIAVNPISLPSQPSAISGPSSVCLNSSNTFSIINTSGVSYAWTYSGAGTLTGSGSSLNLSASSSGSITVTPSNSCGNGTNRLLNIIVNSPPTSVNAGVDAAICAGSSAQLNGTANPPSGSFSVSTAPIGDIPNADPIGYSSSLVVSNSGLNANQISSITLNITHTFTADLDITLIAPNGSFIDLTSDNGGSGDNFINTVFSTSGPSITTGSAPFTGTFTPEQPFSSLTGPADGTWTLKVVDDYVIDIGTLDNWRITFNPVYTLNYSWSPSTGLSASNIANPIASPTSNTTYTLTVSNNGCSSTDDVNISTRNIPAATVSNNGPVCIGSPVNLIASNLAPSLQVARFTNASGQLISSPSFNSTQNNHTIEFWVKPNKTIVLHPQTNSGISGPLNQPLTEYSLAIYPEHGGTNGGIGVSIGTNGVEVIQHGASHFPVTLSHAVSISNSTFTHIAIVHSSNVPTLYINGQLIKTGLSSLRPTFPSCGVSGGSYGYFAGDLDNIRVWSSARTAAEISSNMYLEVPISSTNLIFNLPLNGNTNALTGANATFSGCTFPNASYYTYTWSGTGAPSSSTNETQASSSLFSNTNFTVIANAPGCNGSVSSVNSVTVNNPTTVSALSNGDCVWRGSASSDWNTAGNWLLFNGSAFSIPASAPLISSPPNIIIPASSSICGISNFPSINNVSTAFCNNLIIESGASLTMGGTNGVDTLGILNVSGSWTNNGTFNCGFSRVSFNGSGNISINGNSTFHIVNFNKGSGTSNTIDVNGTITQSSNTAYLYLRNGLLRIQSGGSWIKTSAGPIIGVNSGIHVNGGTFTLNGASLTNNGIFRVSTGTANIGNGSGNSLVNQSNSSFIIDGAATVNIASRLVHSGSGSSFNQSAGTLNLCVNTNTSSTLGTLDITGNSSFSMSGGTINIINPSTGSPKSDYRNLATTVNITGGTLNIGNASTAAGSNFNIEGSMPNLIIDNTTNPKTATITNTSSVIGNLTNNSGSNLILNGSSAFRLSVSGNWNNNGTFTPNTNTVSFNGSSAQSISGNNTFFRLLVNNTSAAGITLNNNVICSSSLTLTSGIISTGINTFHLNNSQADSLLHIVGSASFINGNLRRSISSNTSTYAFPIGDGTSVSDYKKCDLINSSLNGVSFIDASVRSIIESGAESDAFLDTVTKVIQLGTPLSDFVSTAEWKLTPNATPSSGSYGVNLYVANTGLNNADDNRFAVVKRDDNSTTYNDWNSFESTTNIPALGLSGRITNGGTGFAQKTGFTSFSRFGIAKARRFSSPLPVELVSFTAETENKVVLLNWITSSEINCDFFTVEKSNDGINYNLLNNVKGSGNTSNIRNYELYDMEPFSGVSYYKLTQTDFDGTVHDYGIASVNFIPRENFSMYVYPTLARNINQIKIKLSGEENSNVLLELYDVVGKKFYAKKHVLISNEIYTLKEVGNLPPGVYFVSATCNNEHSNYKIVID